MNDDTTLDLLTATGSAEQIVEANAADLSLTIHSNTLVRRSHDLGRAREIKQLLQDLYAAGLSESDIELKEVYSSTNGALFKGMSVRYRFVAHCTDLDRLPDVLSAIGSQKNTTLLNIEWLYGDENAIHDALLETALGRANQLARLTARTLGTQIVGVHRVRESSNNSGWMVPQAPAAARSAAKSVSMISGGDSGGGGEIPVLHTRKMTLDVEVHYRISGWNDPA